MSNANLISPCVIVSEMHEEEVHDGRMQNPHVFKWREYPHLRTLKMILQVHVRKENVLDERNVR